MRGLHQCTPFDLQRKFDGDEDLEHKNQMMMVLVGNTEFWQEDPVIITCLEVNKKKKMKMVVGLL